MNHDAAGRPACRIGEPAYAWLLTGDFLQHPKISLFQTLC